MASIGRRFRTHHTRGRLHPAAIVAICLASAILLTVLVGNLLRLWLDDETYDRLTRGEEESDPLPMGDGAKKRAVNAYPFTLGDDVEKAGGFPAITVKLNDSAGTMSYTSDMTVYLGLTGNQEVRLHESFIELSVYTSYISGVFYPQAFGQSLPDLVYAKGAEEAALLREFSRAGGREIVLCGLPLNETDIGAVCDYVSLVSHAVGDMPVGVAIDATDPSLGEKWEALARLEEVCDFFVLDLRGAVIDPEDADRFPSADALMQDFSYYLTTYSMRPMVCASQTELVSALETRLYPDYQVVAD